MCNSYYLALTLAATLGFKNDDEKYKSWDEYKPLTARDSLLSINAFAGV